MDRKTDGSTAFADLGLSAPLLRAVQEMGYTDTTPVQASAVPPALDGRDVVACAMTGSGKTAAFLLPILQRLEQSKGRGTRALVLSPTRELAAQILEQFHALAKHTKLRGAAVFGGVGAKPQEDAFRSGVDVIIATPGRLLDHMQHDFARMQQLEVLVLDEADRMLDMGFLPDIRRVLRNLPQRARQTMLFSATMPAPIVELSKELLREPVRIDVERRQAPARGVTQAFYPVPSSLKVTLLAALLERGDIGNAIVFCRTKHRANRLAEKLEKRGFAVARIHGNRSQAQRTEALAGFRTGRYRVLVATDIIARGIDVEALEHVVNFDVPGMPEEYIHRVGRTARAGAVGDAYTLISPDEEQDVRAIERAIGHRVERRTLEGFDYTQVEAERLEVPIQERIAEIRARKAEERARAKAKAERRASASGDASQGRTAGGQGGRSGATPKRGRDAAPAAKRDSSAAEGGRRRGPAPVRRDSESQEQRAEQGGGSSRRRRRRGGAGRNRGPAAGRS